MKVLVAYASRHGATQQIAERIAAVLRNSGQEAEARPVTAASDPANFDASVVGSAVYYGRWRKDAADFVRRYRALLASRPVWLFSSGPLGTQAVDADGHDLRKAAIPKEFAEFYESISPRDHRVFFGAPYHSKLGLSEQLVSALPAGRDLFYEGYFRGRNNIESWAANIANELLWLPSTADRVR